MSVYMFIAFSSKRTDHYLPSFHLKFGDIVVSEALSLKILGVWFDKTVYAKVNLICVSTLVCALVTSMLEYVNAVLSGINTNDLAKLQRIQNLASRREATTFISVHWHPIDKRIQ